MPDYKKQYYAEKFNIDLFFRILFLRTGRSIIYILDSVDYYDHNSGKKSFFEKLSIKMFNNITVIHVPLYKETTIFKNEDDICWVVNKKCLELVESDHFFQRINFFGELLVKFCGDQNIIMALKKFSLPFIYRKMLFYHQLKIFNEQDMVFDKIFINNTDFFQISEYLNIDFKSNKKKVSDWLAKIKNLCNLLFYGFFSPLIMREIFRRGVTFFKPKLRLFDTACQIVWGFNTSHATNRTQMKERNICDDEILNSGILDPKKMIFIWGKKKFGRKLLKAEYNADIKHINKLGASSLDETKLRIPITMLINEFIRKGIFIFSFSMMIKSIIKKSSSHIMIYAVQKIFISKQEHEIFCNYVKAKVFISRDDYDPDHIARTIVQNKYNLYNVGLQHSGFQKPEYIPFLAHSYFDRYYCAGSGYRKLWYPYWEKNKAIISVGAQRDHCILNAQKDSLLEKKFKQKYNNQICLVMMITSPNNIFSPQWLMERKYKGIHKLAQISDDMHIILRPRSATTKKIWLQMFPELVEPITNGRLSIETHDFTTQELLAFAEIFVAEDGSSALIEAAHINNLFKTSLNIRYPAHNKLKDIIAEDMEELIIIINDYLKSKKVPKKMNDAIKDIKENFSLEPTESSWSRMSKDINKLLQYGVN